MPTLLPQSKIDGRLLQSVVKSPSLKYLMEQEKKLIKIDVEGHELQGGPVSTKIAAPVDLRRRKFN
jgi:hypothetical protein